MAFRNLQELIQMASSNPKQASGFVKKAQQSGRPVISSNNPGYGGNSPRQQALKRMQPKQQDPAVARRKEAQY